MDNKFYVSLEAARLLKEKGYGRDITNYYDENGFLHDLEYDENYNYFQMSNNDLDLDHYAAPTKAEAIDWLESKGITIDIHWIRFNENRKWNYSIFNCSTCDTIDTKYVYTTRLEAEDAAIIKALELL